MGSKTKATGMKRVTVRFLHEIYTKLKELAKKKVSIAWVVGQAAQQYEWLLFGNSLLRGGK